MNWTNGIWMFITLAIVVLAIIAAFKITRKSSEYVRSIAMIIAGWGSLIGMYILLKYLL
jgi:hypothetical protein